MNKMTLNQKVTQLIAKPIIKGDLFVRKIFGLKLTKSKYKIDRKGVVVRK